MQIIPSPSTEAPRRHNTMPLYPPPPSPPTKVASNEVGGGYLVSHRLTGQQEDRGGWGEKPLHNCPSPEVRQCCCCARAPGEEEDLGPNTRGRWRGGRWGATACCRAKRHICSKLRMSGSKSTIPDKARNCVFCRFPFDEPLIRHVSLASVFQMLRPLTKSGKNYMYEYYTPYVKCLPSTLFSDNIDQERNTLLFFMKPVNSSWKLSPSSAALLHSKFGKWGGGG